MFKVKSTPVIEYWDKDWGKVGQGVNKIVYTLFAKLNIKKVVIIWNLNTFYMSIHYKCLKCQEGNSRNHIIVSDFKKTVCDPAPDVLKSC